MAIMNFPENPSVGDIYTFEGYRYRWSGVKWQSNWVRSDTSLDLFKNELASEGTETVIAGVKAKDLPEAVLTLKWHPLRSKIWTGFIPADGQLVSRTLYPDAWGEVLAGNVPICTEDEWLADPAKRACYTIGDGSTNFRVPDYNGRSAGSLGSVFLRGDGVNSGASGSIQESSNKEHTHTRGTMNITGDYESLAWSGAPYTGAFSKTSSNLVFAAPGGGSIWGGVGVRFDASRSWTGETSSEGSTEARPLNAAGCWVIKMFGAVKNAGSVDAASLATQVSLLDTKVNYVQNMSVGRNLLINGDMRIVQRSGKMPISVPHNYFEYGVDRFYLGNTAGASSNVVMSYRHVAGPNAEFPWAAQAYTVSTGAFTNPGVCYFEQPIEGLNLAGFIGVPLVVSFWVKSSVAGKYSVGFMANDASPYSFITSITINAADTWEKKVVKFPLGVPAAYVTAFDSACRLRLRITFAGNNTTTTQDAWVSGNFFTVSGQAHMPTATGNTFSWTGVQLAVGTEEKPFEHRPYGYELGLCRRYYAIYQQALSNGVWTTLFHVGMRAAPTVGSTIISAGGGTLAFNDITPDTRSVRIDGNSNGASSVAFAMIAEL